MSVSGISNISPYQPEVTQGNFGKVKSEFDRLGQDLKSGNLSQAQADFATLTKDLPQGAQGANGATNPAKQDLNALSQALQSGNVTSAQQAFTSLQNDLQSAAQTQPHHHHHHHSGGQSSSSSAASQDFTQLGQALQTGDLASAQKLFSTLQSDLQTYRNNSQSTNATNPTTATPAISVNG